jgi:GntR family transcriptional repressor for pyruvate dehydrogenase complex
MPSAAKSTGQMTENAKLYRKIADSIADAIEAGQYKLGDRLPTERDLAEQFGVSRPSVREATIALEVMGMIETIHGQGNFVSARARPFTLSSVEVDTEVGAFELIEACRVFESEAAALAATAITDDQIAQLEALVGRMAHEGDFQGEDADREFHLVIARASGNGAIIATIENLWLWRGRSVLARNTLTPTRDMDPQPYIDEHRRVVDALRARDPAAARQAMRDHLERIIDHLLRATETEAVQRTQQEHGARRSALAKRAVV